MRLAYLPANAAWAFLYGDSVVALVGHSRFFAEKKDAVRAAQGLGLKFTGGGS